jgi:sugar lactone lactonase YvrE
LSITKKLGGITISNGIVWNEEKHKMYYIDTYEYEVWEFDFDTQSGRLSNKKVAISIPEEEGMPDGMAIDSEGMLWIAMWQGWKVARWSPETGRKLHEIMIPASLVTSCAFGGDDLQDLYVTTARTGLSDDDLCRQPHAGGLFCVDTGIKGMKAYKFKG